MTGLSVSTASTQTAISTTKFAYVSEVSLKVMTNDKGSTTYKVYASEDGNTWVEIATFKNTDNNTYHEYVSSVTQSFENPVYIKVEITSTKGASNAKSASVEFITIKYYA